jgi:hypothetical protein
MALSPGDLGGRVVRVPGDSGGGRYAGTEEFSSIKDIYTGQRIEISDMSIDHFIPWSFVLHDRLWNLAPVSKRVNSSKSDLLPDLDKHLDTFIDLQYMAYSTAVENNFSKNLLEDYLLLGSGIDTTAVIREPDFREIIKNTITPLHRIAQNQGFGLWR